MVAPQGTTFFRCATVAFFATVQNEGGAQVSFDSLNFKIFVKSGDFSSKSPLFYMNLVFFSIEKREKCLFDEI